MKCNFYFLLSVRGSLYVALKVVFIGKKFVCFFTKQSGSNGKRQLGNNRRLAAQLSRIALDAVGTAYTTAEPRFTVASLLSALCAPGSRSAAGEARAITVDSPSKS